MGLPIDERHDVGTFDAALMHLNRQGIGAIVKGAKDVDPITANGRIGTMRLAPWQPGPLHIRHVRKTRFIDKRQMDQAGFGEPFQVIEFGFGLGKALLRTLFLVTAGNACTASRVP
jgi:hypothetical protein